MFAAGSTPWHKLGAQTINTQSWSEAMKLAQLDWTVSKHQLQYDGVDVDAWGIFRDDSGQFLSSVGSVYTPIQNQFGFEFVDSIMNSVDGSHYESAGALGNGERVWCLAKVPCDFTIAGTDRHETYLLFTNYHNSKQTARCQLTTVRVVCQNTLNAAVNGKSESAIVKVRHTTQAEERLNAVKDIMTSAVASVDNLKSKLQELSERKMNKASTVAVIDRLFPKPTGDAAKSAGTAAAITRRQNVIDDILRLYEDNDGNAVPEIQGSAFNLLNGITNYFDHQKYSNDDLRAGASALFGTGNAVKNQALEILMEETNGNSRMFMKRNQSFVPDASILNQILDVPVAQ